MGPNELLDKNFIPDGDVPLFHVVEQTAVDHCALQTTAGGDWVGIAQEAADEVDVANRRVLRVRVEGISRGIAAGAITINTRVAATVDGTLTTATTGQNVVGIARSPADEAGDWFNVQLTPGLVSA